MKRFGIPALLSVVYVGLLVLIFSSKFGQENSFFFSTQANVQEDLKTDAPLIETVPETDTALEKTPAISQGEEAGAAPESY